MAETEKKSFVKPTVNTPFHIDFSWLETKEENWRMVLGSYLCEKHSTAFSGENASNVLIDSVDPNTGEVTQSDQLLDFLMTHCSQQEGFIPDNGPLTDSIFRLFLSNGNQPLTSMEMSDIFERPADTILKTLTGRIYRGIRPL